MKISSADKFVWNLPKQSLYSQSLYSPETKKKKKFPSPSECRMDCWYFHEITGFTEHLKEPVVDGPFTVTESVTVDGKTD